MKVQSQRNFNPKHKITNSETELQQYNIRHTNYTEEQDIYDFQMRALML